MRSITARTREAAGFGQREKELQVVPVHARLRIIAHSLRRNWRSANDDAVIQLRSRRRVNLVRGAKTGCTRHALVTSNGVAMNKTLTASLVISTLALAGSPAFAQMTVESARASLVPFYQALNA